MVFDPNLGIWTSLTPYAIWQNYKGRRNGRGRNKKKRPNKWLPFLLLLLIALALAGCSNPPPDQTRTPDCTATPKPTGTHALPPPIVSTLPPTPAPPPTVTPEPTSAPPPTPTETQLPPLPTPIVFPYPDFTMSNPFGSQSYMRLNEFGNTKYGEQKDLGGGQGIGHDGLDIITSTDSDTNPESRQVYAPVAGWIADYQNSTGTITVWNVKDANGRDYPGLVVKLTHVAPPSGSMVKGQALTYYGSYGIFDGTRPHLHLGLLWHRNGDYRDSSPGNVIYFDPESYISG